MRPTTTGLQLDRSANEILTAILQAEEALRSKAKPGKVVLRLATQCYTCYDWLPRVLQRYRQQCTACDVRIVLDATPDPIQALLQEQIEVAIVDQFSRKDRRIQVGRIFSDELLAVVSASHPWATRRSISPQDFATERLIAHNCSPDHNILLRRILRPARIVPAETYEVPLTEAILELVGAGFGVAALAGWAVASHLKKGRIRGLPIGKNGFTRYWSIAMLRSTSRLEHIKQLVSLLSRELPTRVR